MRKVLGTFKGAMSQLLSCIATFMFGLGSPTENNSKKNVDSQYLKIFFSDKLPVDDRPRFAISFPLVVPSRHKRNLKLVIRSVKSTFIYQIQ